jgi:heat shock protein HslJ
LPIVGPRWRLTELEGSDVYLEDGSPELTFGENNRVSGSTGCNQLSGPYNYRDTALSFGPIATTRRACADTEKRELETRFDTVFARVDGVRVERVHLELLHGAQPIARFVAQE